MKLDRACSEPDSPSAESAGSDPSAQARRMLGLDPGAMCWLNEPRRWALDAGGVLAMTAQADTDFWQGTHYGFRRDNGHLLSYPTKQDFICELLLRFDPTHQYDQAGLMVRLDHHCWIKTSIEFEPDGCSRLGAVVTNAGYSDWSTQDVPRSMTSVSLQMIRTGSDFILNWRPDVSQRWSQLRIAHLSTGRDDSTLLLGPYACAPTGPGFTAHFEHFSLQM